MERDLFLAPNLRKDRPRPILQICTKVVAFVKVKVRLHSGRDTHHELHIEARLRLRGCVARVAVEALHAIVTPRQEGGHKLLKKESQVSVIHRLPLELGDGLAVAVEGIAAHVNTRDVVDVSDHRRGHRDWQGSGTATANPTANPTGDGAGQPPGERHAMQSEDSGDGVGNVMWE